MSLPSEVVGAATHAACFVRLRRATARLRFPRVADTQDVPLYLLQMAQHGHLSAARIPRPNGVQNGTVPGERATRPPRRVQGAFAGLAETIHDGLVQLEQQVVLRRVGEERMESAVRFHTGLAVGHLARLLREGCLHPPDLGFRGARGGQRGDLGLDDLSSFERVPQGVFLLWGRRAPRSEKHVEAGRDVGAVAG